MAVDLISLQREAESHLGAGRYQDAHTVCMQILGQDPKFPAAYYVLANIAADHDQPAKAAEVVARAIQLAPANPTYHAFLGRCMVAANRAEDGVRAARHAASLNPEDAHTLDTIGVVLSRAGRHEEALPYFRRATNAAPGVAAYQYNLAASAQFSGGFDEAESAYRTTLALHPDHARASSGLSQLRKATPADNGIEVMTRQFDALTDPKDKQNIGHAIAKELEDLGQLRDSFAWLERAKDARRKSSSEDQALMRDVFTAGAVLPARSSTSAEQRPVFIAGLPRTGTTLLDRVLSSHAEVVSAGELSAFALSVKQVTATPGALVMDAPTIAQANQLNEAQLGDIAARYMERVPAEFTQHARFIDKMPFNFFYAPLIHRALPQARIVVLRRNPLDSILSNFRQLFSTDFSYYQYALDLAWAAEFYVEFHRHCESLREMLPADRYMEIWYEELVADLPAQARRAVDFLSLPWDEACLRFQDNQAPVATASSVQVRQPLYSTSVGRWQRYAELLDPAKRILERAGIDYA